jgi:hypothetical protein
MEPNFPARVVTEIVPIPYGFETIMVFDCPIPNVEGTCDYGKIWIATIIPDGEQLSLIAAEPATGMPGTVSGKLYGMSRTSAAQALADAVANLTTAARRRPADRDDPDPTPPGPGSSPNTTRSST